MFSGFALLPSLRNEKLVPEVKSRANASDHRCCRQWADVIKEPTEKCQGKSLASGAPRQGPMTGLNADHLVV